MAGEADAEFIISFKHLGRLNRKTPVSRLLLLDQPDEQRGCEEIVASGSSSPREAQPYKGTVSIAGAKSGRAADLFTPSDTFTGLERHVLEQLGLVLSGTTFSASLRPQGLTIGRSAQQG